MNHPKSGDEIKGGWQIAKYLEAKNKKKTLAGPWKELYRGSGLEGFLFHIGVGIVIVDGFQVF